MSKVEKSSENVPVELSEIDDEKNSEPRKKSAKNVKKSTSLKRSKTKCRDDRFPISKPRSRSLSVESLNSFGSEAFYYENNKLCDVNDLEGCYTSFDEFSEDMKNQKMKHIALRRDLLKHLKRSLSEDKKVEEDEKVKSSIYLTLTFL